jgi:predicted nucleic acid-binding protein
MTRRGAQPVVTLDASIWIAALRINEPAHAIANQLLQTLLERDAAFVQPTLFAVEVAGAMRRRTGDPMRAQRAVDRIASLAATIVPVDEPLAVEASTLALELGLSGADACYVAVSRRHETTLLTLDDTLIGRAAVSADVSSPVAWMSRVV